MRRLDNLFDLIVDKDNLRLAFKKARKRGRKTKNGRRIVRKFEEHLEENLDKLQESLLSGNYKTSNYLKKTIYEPKKRDIFILPFYPDRIVHHAIMNILEPIWDARLESQVYSSRKGKGQHKGSQYCMQMVRQYKYCLKCDIRKFYPSINHEKLKAIIHQKIKDERLLVLLDEIVDSPGGDTNVPIGNLVSQWFGNIYMDVLDKYIKQELRVKPYIRYCDDFLLFSDSKEDLNRWKELIQEFLEKELFLEFSKANIFPVTRGVDFLGYRHFPEGYILVRKSTSKREKKIIKSIPYQLDHHIITIDQAISKVASIQGIIKHANAYNFRCSLDLDHLKEVLMTMKAEKYSDFATKISKKPDGTKLAVDDIINKEIIVVKLDIFKSVKDKGSDCLTVIFKYPDDEDHQYFIYTSSLVMIDQSKECMDHLPFSTTIIRKRTDDNKQYLSFS